MAKPLPQKLPEKRMAHGFDENKIVAKEGGTVAGVARDELEKRSGERVVSPDNYLKEIESAKRKKLSKK